MCTNTSTSMSTDLPLHIYGSMKLHTAAQTTPSQGIKFACVIPDIINLLSMRYKLIKYLTIAGETS